MELDAETVQIKLCVHVPLRVYGTSSRTEPPPHRAGAGCWLQLAPDVSRQDRR